jgi:hypothetical protein
VAKWQAGFYRNATYCSNSTGTWEVTMRMPIQTINGQNLDALVFLDIQVAHSTVKTEVTELVKYLSCPSSFRHRS